MFRSRFASLSSCLPVGVLILIGIWIQCHPELMHRAFGRADLLWVSVLSACPLAVWLTSWRASQAATILLWCLGLLLGGTIWFGFFSDPSTGPMDLPIRPFYAALFGIVCFCFVVSLPFSCDRKANSDSHSPTWASGVLVVLMGFLVPVSYADSISRGAHEKLAEALQTNRPAKAYQFASLLLVTDPQATLFDTPLPRLHALLDEDLKSLRESVSRPMPMRMSLAEIGQRVMALIQLERDQEALKVLKPLMKNPASAPVAMDFCGLCSQRLGRWEDSLMWYKKSEEFWREQPLSPQRDQALISAYKGIAFAARKLDRPTAAEQAYHDALVVEPTAELHDLLARHYEEQQQTSKAHMHAKQAMTLDPQRYRAEAQELMSGMQRSHFGCLKMK